MAATSASVNSFDAFFDMLCLLGQTGGDLALRDGGLLATTAMDVPQMDGRGPEPDPDPGACVPPFDAAAAARALGAVSPDLVVVHAKTYHV